MALHFFLRSYLVRHDICVCFGGDMGKREGSKQPARGLSANFHMCASRHQSILTMCISMRNFGLCVCAFPPTRTRWHREASLPASTTNALPSLLLRMTARFYGWLDYVRKHSRALIVGKPRLRGIMASFAPPPFSLSTLERKERARRGEKREDGGKGVRCLGWRGRWMVLQTAEPDGTEPLSSLESQ